MELVQTCPVCGRKIKEGEGVQGVVITEIYTCGVFYSVHHGLKLFCSEECMNKWNMLMNERLEELRKKCDLFILGLTLFIIFVSPLFLVSPLLLLFLLLLLLWGALPYHDRFSRIALEKGP